VIYALDTGFFYRLLTDPEGVQQAWEEIGAGTSEGVVSCITCFELYRHGLRGSLPRRATEALLQAVPQACTVVAIDDLGATARTARLAHGNGRSMADAFILEAALRHAADRLYTSDRDFERYQGDIDVRLV
jgi:predicted nucleic acid-binding protein